MRGKLKDEISVLTEKKVNPYFIKIKREEKSYELFYYFIQFKLNSLITLREIMQCT